MTRSNKPRELNLTALQRFQDLSSTVKSIGCQTLSVDGAHVLDAGVETSSSLEAGLGLASLCLGNAATIELSPAPQESVSDLLVTVRTDDPIWACLGGQYAGWPASVGDFFAMASGPMRMLRGREEMLEQLGLTGQASPDSVAVGVLESDKLPGEDVIQDLAWQCGVPTNQLHLAVAPSTSIAGSVQVVARSVETALHKLHALDFDVSTIVSAYGSAPLSPPAKPGDTIGGIGRTNDAMLYGARVTLWTNASDDAIEAVAKQVPSNSSSDYGQPFAKIFKQYDYDFYKVDPMLFSPAVVTIHSLSSGRSWRVGKVATEILKQSFGIA